MGQKIQTLIDSEVCVELSNADLESAIGATVAKKYIRKLAKNPRSGWAGSSKKIAAAGDDQLVLPEFANEDDKDLVW